MLLLSSDLDPKLCHLLNKVLQSFSLLGKYLRWIITLVERACIGNHLKDEATKCPVINTFAMSLTLDDFRSHVIRRATHGEGAAVMDALGKPHVNQLWISTFTDHCVLRLEITIHYSFAMHVF